MIRHDGGGVLLDIEGTTSSILYVRDVMFPYARRELASFLDQRFDDDAVRLACEQIARDAGYDGSEAFYADRDGEPRDVVRDEVLRLMDGDVKATGLKALQGLIWRAGFETGEMKAHVYPEVPAALARWREQGADLRVFSSGSVAAQRLFFGHTEVGDLLPLFSGHYDTETGPKKEASSYRAIAAESGLDPASILFVSDVVAELDAAKEAGMPTALSVRPENDPVTDVGDHRVVQTFDEIEVVPDLAR